MGFFGLIPFTVVTIFAVVIFFVGRHYATKHGRRLAQVEATPLVKGAQVAGHVGETCKMLGEVIAPGGTLESPIEGLKCVWYRLLVEEQQSRTVRDSKGNTSTKKTWVPVIDAAKMVPCGIEDKDGAIEVSLIEADMLIRDGAKKQSGFFTDVPAGLRTLIEEEYGRDTKGGWFKSKKNLRIKEQVLEVGEKALVVGKVKLLRTTRGVRPRFVRGKHPLIVTDKDDGGLKSHFWWSVFWGRLAMIGGAVVAALALVGFFWVLYAATMAAIYGPPPKPKTDPGTGLLAELQAKDKWVRIRAANRIAKGPKEDEAEKRAEVAAALLANLQVSDKEVVGAAAEALPAWTDAGDAPKLLELLADKRVEVRKAAVRGLAKADTPEGPAEIVKLLADKDVHGDAHEALKKMKAGEPALRSYLQTKAYGKSDNAARDACRILGEVGTKESLPVLDELAKAKGGPAGEAKKAAAAIRKRAP